ncbi:flavoprotein [Paenibacillus sp. LMG 31461]|uniref:Flavoprotein n=1 Tax=Paenibacillus plantarum TaxID=2654975 RepID=A0ABX1XLS8_9BACL|nr:NADPH-dependent FMN reductase [Paenibacillus plantarum]NOU68779.1 flavoprotein [Paenibacillus plantarum]
MENRIKIVAISGSLRQKSSNTALMHAIIALAPDNMDFTVYGGLGDLPHFNPDIDVDDGPESVTELRTQLNESDAVLICTPEYGNGVPGVLKNALDWLVSSGEFMNKPTSVISASPTPLGGDKAHASILLTLNMINAKIVEGGTMMISHINLKLNKDGNITDSSTEQGLRSVLEGLAVACAN